MSACVCNVVLVITNALSSPSVQFAGIYQANDGKCHLRPFTSSVAYYPNVLGEQIYSEDSLLYVRGFNENILYVWV